MLTSGRRYLGLANHLAIWPGVAIMLAVYVVGGISGAHINPAITLALAACAETGFFQQLHARPQTPCAPSPRTGRTCAHEGPTSDWLVSATVRLQRTTTS